MPDADGFVQRPVGISIPARHTGMTARLAATADNGKAVVLRSQDSAAGYRAGLALRGLRLRTQRQPDGTCLAWCEPDPTLGRRP